MSLDDLHKSVDGLRVLRDQLPEDQQEIKSRASRLIEDLERQIEDLGDRDPAEEEGWGSLLEGLRHFGEQFEAEHPRITEAANRVSMMLSGMGI